MTKAYIHLSMFIL